MSADDSIQLQIYSEQWPKLAANEIARLRAQIPSLSSLKIEHIGSTSVPGLTAKPILDLAIEVARIEDGLPAVAALESIGYSYWRHNPDTKHLFFVKGLPPKGTGRTHHLHFFEQDRFAEHLRFRDLLIQNQQLADEYQKLKIELAEKFRHDREAYTEAKSAFIRAALEGRPPSPSRP